MQTFLPYQDFEKSAQCLDYKRLGKQRLEARQIVDTIEGRSFGWIHHPIVKMWWNYVEALKEYFNVMSGEWVLRGYQHNMGYYVIDEVSYPHWLGREEFHLSHQSNLIRKFPAHYGPMFPDVPNNLKYVWYKE